MSKYKILIKENWFKLSILLLLLISIGSAFYWYGWRPTQIKKECVNKITEFYKERKENDTFASDPSGDEMLTALEFCLKSRGL